MEFIPIYLIFAPIVCSIFVYLFNNKYTNYVVFLMQSLISVLSIKYYTSNNSLINEKTILIGNWNERIAITLRNDSLSMAFIFLSIFMWWVILIYCWEKRKEDGKFLFFLLFLEGTFLGILQTNDLFNLFVFIEITTIISTILIIYKKDGYSVRSGLYYLLFNSVGMIFYLIGLILLYNISGTLNMSIISNNILQIKDTYAVKLSYIFIISAIGVKSAFFPVYNWLPRAHGSAPSSISALLSGLLIKSGLYAFIRFNHIFNYNNFHEFFFVLGFFTAISGALFAISQKDIKQILAFHTISQIGIILMGLSSMDNKLYLGGLIHIFNHAFFKSLLFMGAGIIINTYGIRKVTQIRGVFKTLPYTSIFMIVGMLSITGAPLLNGFVSKSMIKYSLNKSITKQIMLLIVNLGTSISFIKLSQIFFGELNVKKKRHLHSNFSMFIVAGMCIVFGLFYVPIVDFLFAIDISYVKVFKPYNFIKYISTLAIGYIIYENLIVKEYKFLKKLRHTNISFRTTNYLLIVFIFIMIVNTFM